MDESKLTPWFPVGVQPSRPGVYLTRRNGEQVEGRDYYSQWTGLFWLIDSDNPASAAHDSGKEVSGYQLRSWCGLAENPDG